MKNWFSYYAHDVIIFGLFIAGCMGKEKKLLLKILNILSKYLPLMTLIVLYNSTHMYIGVDPTQRFGGDPGFVRENIELLYPSFFFAFSYKDQSIVNKISLVICILLLFYAAYRTATREYFVFGVIGTIFIVWSFKNQIQTKQDRIFILGVILLGFFCIITFLLFYEIDYRNFYVVERLLDRAFHSEYRLTEMQTMYKDLPYLNKIIGKGMGASHNSLKFLEVIHGIPMTHLGIGHLLLKGGLIFLVIFTLIVLYVSLNSIIYNNYMLKINMLWILLFLARSLFMHTAFGLNLSFLLFCILLGNSISILAKNNKTHVTSQKRFNIRA